MAWYVVPAVKAQFRDANAIAPNRKKTSDGTIGDTSHAARPSDHNPDRNSRPPGAVRAGDVTHDPAGGWDAHKRVREAIARRDRRIKYVISMRKIISYYAVGGYPPFAERPYNGSNPHDKHAHTSVRPEFGNDDSAWWGEEDELAGVGDQILAEVQALAKRLEDVEESLGKRYPGGPSIQKALVKYMDDDADPQTPKIPEEHLNVLNDKVDELLNRQAEMEARLLAIEIALAAPDNG